MHGSRCGALALCTCSLCMARAVTRLPSAPARSRMTAPAPGQSLLSAATEAVRDAAPFRYKVRVATSVCALLASLPAPICSLRLPQFSLSLSPTLYHLRYCCSRLALLALCARPLALACTSICRCSVLILVLPSIACAVAPVWPCRLSCSLARPLPSCFPLSARGCEVVVGSNGPMVSA